MDIIIQALGMPFNGETIYKQSLGGSETAGYYLARALAKRGHRVRVFTTSDEGGDWDGVHYTPAGQPNQHEPFGHAFHMYVSKTPHDVLIVQRQPRVFHYQWASRVNILQNHDLALMRYTNDIGAAAWNINAVTAVSYWHAKQMSEVYPVPFNRIDVVHNGVDLDLYTGETDEQITHDKDAFKMLYQARPERGFEHLVRPGGIMEKLVDTPALLYYCRYDHTTEEMAPFYKQLDEWADKLPNVVMMGSLTKPKLAKVQQSMDLMVYPTSFEEVSCISAMEAMAAGLPFLSSECGALPETCKGSGSKLLSLKSGKADEDAFVERIKSWCKSKQHLQKSAEKQKVAAQMFTWDHAAQEMEAICERELHAQRRNPTTVVKNAMEQADIRLASNMLEMTSGAVLDTIGERMKRELGLYSFRFNSDDYKDHYDKRQAEWYDEFEESVIGENVTGTSRFMAMATAMNKKMTDARRQGLRILDYGCAHGHYVIPLAKSAPKCEFFGMDISERSIAAAGKWMLKDKVTNLTLVHGAEESLTLEQLCEREVVSIAVGEPIKNQPDTIWRKFDIILAGEVLEHVADPLALIERFRSILESDGVIIFSTPFGRWEYTNRDLYPNYREHIWNFSKEQLRALFKDHECEITCGASNADECGFALGSWIAAVQFKNSDPITEIPEVSAPFLRETVSACLIVKDGETSLARCLNSIANHVDEVVIGIDSATKDNTVDVIDHFIARNQWLPVTTIDIKPAVETGFDEARNAVHDIAVGDWILWLDADEEMVHPAAIQKYLKPSLVDAFHLPQIHYSAEPAQVLTTDHPCRLYRNDGTIRIYGVVHEHAELGPGKGIPAACMREDVQFAHIGYITEAVRRKRYQRNMPLLKRDLERYPDRLLNRYLAIRDIAQGIVFESREIGGFLDHHRKEAEKAIQFFGDLIDDKRPVTRLLLDSLEYYSACVEVLGTGFEAEIEFKTIVPPLSAGSKFKGRFFNRDHFKRLTNRLFEEATKHYESKYV